MGELTLRGLNVTSCDQLKLQKKGLMHDLLNFNHQPTVRVYSNWYY